jgi:hypothetical protein
MQNQIRIKKVRPKYPHISVKSIAACNIVIPRHSKKFSKKNLYKSQLGQNYKTQISSYLSSASILYLLTDYWQNGSTEQLKFLFILICNSKMSSNITNFKKKLFLQLSQNGTTDCHGFPNFVCVQMTSDLTFWIM